MMKNFVALILLVCVQAAAADLNNGLIGAWTFEEYSTTPVLHGGAEIVKSGKFGKSLNLNGIDAYATVELSHQAEAALEKAFTIAYWLYVRVGNDHSGIYKGESVWGPHYTFRALVTSESDMMWGTTNTTGETWFWTPDVIRPKAWVHVALTADGKQVTAYVTVDGKTTIPPSPNKPQNPNQTPAPYRLFPNEPLVMGRGVGFEGDPQKIQYLDGMIDEVMLWARALDKAEVTALGAGERPILAVNAIGKLTTTWGNIKVR